MGKFDGKRLLILGSNVGTVDIIEYAKKNGAYTIVADNRPVERSVGKQFADEAVMISTGDVEALKVYIKDNQVNGVLAGVSEFNLLNAMELCNYFGFPFYCTRQQWDLVENKECFRKLCLDYSVPCPITFYTGACPAESVLSSMPLPVVVKPVDACASVGVSICRELENVKRAVQDAREKSGKGRIIIEKYFEGEEFAAHYSVVNGEVSLACVDNRVPISLHDGSVTTVPLARIYPSDFIDEYVFQVDGSVRMMIKSLGLQTGVFFVQGFYNRNLSRFCIFEAGLRCAGEAPYRFLKKVNGSSFMDNLVDYALSCPTRELPKDDAYLKGRHCCVTSFVSKGGEIDKIIGYEETISRIRSLVDAECRYHAGDVVPNGDTLRQIVMRFVLVCDTIEEMVADIREINNTIQVLGRDGKDMCLRFDAGQLLNPYPRKS
jgi:hypothetical protein